MLISARDAGNAPQTITIADCYTSPNRKNIRTATTLDSLFSDDFGGSAINAAKWDVLDGGLGLNPNLGFGTLTQVAIGSGVTMGPGTVSSSGLAVAMGTTLNAELWHLSKQVFAGKEDILVILSKSQANVNNSIFVGLVEVDPTTLVPLLNPSLAGDFTNRGGVEFGKSAVTTAYHAEAIGDSSGTVALSAVGVATAWSTAQECLIEIDSRDIHAQTSLVDAVASKANGVRVSSQCPNDQKLYKLLIRFLNVGVPTATTVTINRVLVVDNYEQRVQVSSGEGDVVGSKAIPVGLVNSNLPLTASQFGVNLVPGATAGPATVHKLQSAATTNATSVKVSQGTVVGGYLRNRHATLERYFKFFLKASAPTVGTDTPVLIIGIPPLDKVYIADIVGAAGYHMATGIAYAITGAYTDLDTTAIGAGDVDVNLIYT